MNKLWLWGIVMMFFIMAAAHDSYGSSTFKVPDSPQENYFQKAVNDTIGANSNRMVPRYRDMWCVGDLWIVHLNADNHANVNMIRGMIFLNSREIFTKVFNERNEVKKLSLNWYYPVPVGDGKRRDVPIIKIIMKREKVLNTDWYRTPVWELSQLADLYSEHPEFHNLD